MSPAFEPCPIIGIGEAVFEGELPEREALEGLSIVPGPSSGVTIKVRYGCETVTGERDKGENSHHRQNAIGLSPNCYRSGTCCEYIIGEESLATNYGVEESPMGDTCSRGDSVGKPAGQRQCQT
jgi:hypothetical protein